MKKFLAAIIFLIICAANVNCLAAPSGAMRLGILPVFKAAAVSADLTLDDTEIATGVIYAGMTNCADFEILSRTDVDKLVQEHELTATGLIDNSTAPAFGKMLGAEYLLITNVTGLSSRKKTASVVGTGSKNYIVTARMAGRIVEVESGRVVLAATSSATSGNQDESFEKAAENLVDKLLENLEAKKRARQ